VEKIMTQINPNMYDINYESNDEERIKWEAENPPASLRPDGDVFINRNMID